MKKIMLGISLAAGLLCALACSSTPETANRNTATTTSTTTNTTTSTSNNSASPSGAANTTNSGAANSNAANTATTRSEAGKQDFTLVNATGVEIDKVYISPHDKDDWEEDILGRDTLPDGQSVDIKFHRNETAAMWDLRVEDKQGNSIEWENLNLLEISKVTLHYENGKATAVTQ